MATAYLQNEQGRIISTERPEYWENTAGFTRLTVKAGKAAYHEQMCSDIRELLAPGDTVYTVLRHVSASGMSRNISLLVAAIGDDGKPYVRDISNLAAQAMGDKVSQNGGIIISGAGMDMGFHLVYQLGCTLWPNGTPKPHSRRNGEPDTAGGYALKHSWL